MRLCDMPFDDLYMPVTESGCWIWLYCITKKGYGLLNYRKGSPVRAHRLSYQIHVGEIPKGMMVCHKCDVPSCVNPDHLFLGTNMDNMFDKASKGRQTHGDGSGSRKIDAAIAREIFLAKGTHSRIAEKYRVSQSNVTRIKHGILWGKETLILRTGFEPEAGKP